MTASTSTTKQRKNGNAQQQHQQLKGNIYSINNEPLQQKIDHESTDGHEKIQYNYNKLTTTTTTSITSNTSSSWKLRTILIVFLLGTIIFWVISTNSSSTTSDPYQNYKQIEQDIYSNTATSTKTKIAQQEQEGETTTTNNGIGFNTKINDPLQSHICQTISSPSSITNDCITYYPLIDLADYITQEEMMSHTSLFSLRGGKDNNNNKIMNQTSINDRIVSNIIKISNFNDFGILTRKGYKGGLLSQQINQDRVFYMISPSYYNSITRTNKNEQQHATNKKKSAQFLLGLFDGHGEQGHVISQYALKQYPSIFSKELQKTPYVQEAITKSFQILDTTLPRTEAIQSGCTAIVCFLHDDTLYLANTGDSHVYVAIYHEKTDNVEIIYKNQLHKPHMLKERQRIESLGGEVYIPPDDDIALEQLGQPKDTETSRVFIGEMALAMSRSIGDWEGISIGVIADPTIDVMNIAELKEKYSNLFLFVASDGLIDEVTPLIASAYIANGLFKDSNMKDASGTGNTANVLESCELLIRMASESWLKKFGFYRDDISIVASKI